MIDSSTTSFADRLLTRSPMVPADVISSPDDTTISSAEALDEAFAGRMCELIRGDGSVEVMPAHRWSGDASPADLELFVDPCNGATLDVGCGPGRLTGALTDRGLHALGVDISPEAVRQTRARGAGALHRDIFIDLPGATEWKHILLADGNIGMGGDPRRLLRRIAELLGRRGTVLIELAGPGVELLQEQVWMRVGQRTSRPFTWATVGVDAIGEIAAAAELAVTDVRCIFGRHVATLQHRTASGAGSET